MSKKQPTTASTPAFAINDRVFVQTAATLQTRATGTVVDISKSGWFIVQLDDTNSEAVLTNTKGKVSARASSLAPLTEAPKTDSPAPADKGQSTEGNDQQADDPEALPLPKDEQPMAKALRLARQRYEKTKRPDGSRSADNGDPVARELRDYEPLEVADLADKVFKVPAGTHRAKYAHLNPGQIRMNSGNRIRHEWKRANEEGDETAILHVAKLLNLVEVDDDEEAGE